MKTRGPTSLWKFLSELLKDSQYHVAVISDDNSDSISNPAIKDGKEALDLVNDLGGNLIIYEMTGWHMLRQFYNWTRLRNWFNFKIKAVAIASEADGLACLHWIDESFGRKLEIMRENRMIFKIERAANAAYEFTYEWNSARGRWQPIDPFKDKKPPGLHHHIMHRPRCS